MEISRWATLAKYSWFDTWRNSAGPPPRQDAGVRQEALRQGGQLEHPLLEREVAGQVVHADPQHLHVLEAAQLIQLLLVIDAPREHLPQFLPQVGLRLDPGREGLPPEGVQQLGGRAGGG